jgi:hypothetical protein
LYSPINPNPKPVAVEKLILPTLTTFITFFMFETCATRMRAKEEGLCGPCSTKNSYFDARMNTLFIKPAMALV